MDRRRFLAGAGALAGALAGCVSAPRRSDRADGGPGGDDTTDDRRVAGAGGPLSEEQLPVPRSELVRGAPRNAIPAITDPVFGDDWSDVAVNAWSQYRGEYTARPRLSPGDEVVGIARDGEARAYPLKLLAYHEVVNDTFDVPVLVTYCPLCGSSLTARREVDGREATFGVSGLLYRSDLVLYDVPTETLWSQLAATAIRGPHTGDRLRLVPSTLSTWGRWTEAHPDTVVLRPPPESFTIGGQIDFDYSRDRYAAYRASERVGVSGDPWEGELHPKTRVLGVAAGGEARAYPFPAVSEAGVVNDTVGDLPVVVAAGPGESPSVHSGSMHAYVRRVDGERLRFEAAGDARMTAGGSTWDVTTGRALGGPHEGRRLAQAGGATAVFWFAWREFHPDTTVYGSGAR